MFSTTAGAAGTEACRTQPNASSLALPSPAQPQVSPLYLALRQRYHQAKASLAAQALGRAIISACPPSRPTHTRRRARTSACGTGSDAGPV